MELLRGLNEMMCVWCSAGGLAWSGLSNGGCHSSIQTGPPESGVLGRRVAGSKLVCVCGGGRAGEVGAPQKSWEKALPFTLRDLLPPEPLSVPAPGLPLLPHHTPLVERISGPAHSSCKAPGDRETAPGARDSVVLASMLEPQFVALSDLPNSGGDGSDEVMEVKWVHR